jgi:hypothetical protein
MLEVMIVHVAPPESVMLVTVEPWESPNSIAVSPAVVVIVQVAEFAAVPEGTFVQLVGAAMSWVTPLVKLEPDAVSLNVAEESLKFSHNDGLLMLTALSKVFCGFVAWALTRTLSKRTAAAISFFITGSFLSPESLL